MDLAQAVAKLLEHLIRLNHGGIDLSRVADVEAERGCWKSLEKEIKLLHGSSDGFALIHVLDAELRSQETPVRIVFQRIGVNDDRPAVVPIVIEFLKDPVLCLRRKLTGGVNGDVAEPGKIELIE